MQTLVVIYDPKGLTVYYQVKNYIYEENGFTIPELKYRISLQIIYVYYILINI